MRATRPSPPACAELLYKIAWCHQISVGVSQPTQSAPPEPGVLSVMNMRWKQNTRVGMAGRVTGDVAERAFVNSKRARFGPPRGTWLPLTYATTPPPQPEPVEPQNSTEFVVAQNVVALPRANV